MLVLIDKMRPECAVIVHQTLMPETLNFQTSQVQVPVPPYMPERSSALVLRTKSLNAKQKKVDLIYLTYTDHYIPKQQNIHSF